MDYNGLRISGIDYESMADGEGIRAVIFFSGCTHNCPGCHNKESQDFNYGDLVTDELIGEINENIKHRPYLDGVTFSGGDPMCSAVGVLRVLDRLEIPNDDLWIYSGYTFDEIIESKNQDMIELLSRAKILVDGLFVLSLADKRLRFRGSYNQHIVDVQESLNNNIF